MKTFSLFIVIVLALLTTDIHAQSPVRNVLYTFTRNEIMACGEHHIIQHQLDRYRFAFLVKDTVTEKHTLIFNGKRIPLYGDWGYTLWSMGYLNVNEPDGYIIMDSDEKGYYVNRRGQKEGPYEWARWEEDYDSSNPDMIYHYVLAGRVYDNINGRVRKSQGIFVMMSSGDDSDTRYISVNGKLDQVSGYGRLIVRGNHYAYINNKGILYFNGRMIYTVSNIKGAAINKKGDYAYYYNMEQQIPARYYIGKNGVKLNEEAYLGINDLYLTEDGEVAYAYRKGNCWSVHIPGVEESTGYDYVENFIYLESGNYAYTYRKDGKYYVRIKGQTDKGPYDNRCRDLRINEKGQFIYGYQLNELNHNFFVKINNNEYGPFDYVTNIKLSEEGCYSFSFEKASKCYTNNNGTITQVDDGSYIDIDSDDGNHSFYSDYTYDYVVIDGQRVGHSPAIKGWYDKDKHAFVWNSIEGNELVAYEYKLD